jgi:hypothetical protein
MITLRDELERSRRRCAELSEIEARRRGLELRCVGLERVVEELMAAVEYMKTQSGPTHAGQDSISTEELRGLGIQVSPETRLDSRRMAIRRRAGQFVIYCRRRFIPYQMRAVILVMIAQWKNFDLIDQTLSAVVVLLGAMLGMTFMLIERGKDLLKVKSRK